MADLGGAASGAMSGAYLGSTFGPAGTAVGGVLGGVAGLFGGKKKKPKPKKVSTLDPQQQQLYNEYISSIRGEGPFGDMYKFNADKANANFDLNYSRPAYRNFEENIIPGITGQYRQGNLMNSSYSAGALGKAGRDVQESLNAQRSNYLYQGEQQANQNRMNAINNVLNLQTFAYQQPQEEGPNQMDRILGMVGKRAGKWAGGLVDDYVNKYGPKVA